MDKNNYLTPQEQKIWQYIRDKDIIDNELIKDIFPEIKNNKRNKILHNLYKKDYIKRARKSLYYNPELLNDYYKLALRIKDGYLGLSSALKYYNLIEYEDYTIFIITKKYQKNVNINGTKYNIKFIPLKELFVGFEKKNNFYVSTIEKTIIDCFIKSRYVSYSVITKAIYDSNIDWKEFVKLIKKIKNNSLNQRLGYLLELMKKITGYKIPNFVLETLEKGIKTPIKLSNLKGKTTYNPKWKVQDNIGSEEILSWWQ